MQNKKRNVLLPPWKHQTSVQLNLITRDAKLAKVLFMYVDVVGGPHTATGVNLTAKKTKTAKCGLCYLGCIEIDRLTLDALRTP